MIIITKPAPNIHGLCHGGWIGLIEDGSRVWCGRVLGTMVVDADLFLLNSASHGQARSTQTPPTPAYISIRLSYPLGRRFAVFPFPSAWQTACSTYPPTRRPSTCWLVCLLACLLACLPSCFPVCLPGACLHACLLACLPGWLPACHI